MGSNFDRAAAFDGTTYDMSRNRTEWLLDRRLLLAVFVAAVVILAFRHEPWFDEWQAWLIARDSSSLGGVLTNSRYEGHPPLWYFLLWVVSRVSRDVLAMQLANAAIAAATAAVILWRAPFPRLVCAALVFGYFPLYEYGTISRSYGLSLLLVVLVCAEASRPHRRTLVLSVLLGLMMLTSAHAFLVALALASAITVDTVIERSHGGLSIRRSIRPRPQFLAGGAIMAICATWSLLQIAPPADGAFGVGFNTGNARATYPNFGQIAVAALIGDGVPATTTVRWAIASLIGLVIVVAVGWYVRDRLASLTLWIVGTGLLVGFAWLRFPGSIRHYGSFFMVGLATLWLHHRFVQTTVKRTSRAESRLLSVGLVVILVAQIVFGATAAMNDFFRPFSNTSDAAQWIDDRDLSDALLIASYPDFVAAGVGGYLDRPMLYLEQDRLGTFVLFRNDRQQVTVSDVVEAAQTAISDGRTVIVLTRSPLEGDLGPVRLRLGAMFTDSIRGREQMYVYVAGEH